METPASFLPLSPHQFHILLALTDAERHGYALIQDIHRRTGGELRLGTGTLYTAIARLVELGLIADTGRNDERRRYYRLTRIGQGRVESGDGPARGARPSRARTRYPAVRAVSVAEAIMNRVPIAVRIARVIHRALLFLVPGDVRRRYRAEMLTTFETASAEAGARGPGALCRLLFDEVTDLATARRANRPVPVTVRRRAAGWTDAGHVPRSAAVSVAAGLASAPTTAGVSRRGCDHTWRRSRDNHGGLLARGHGADQAAALPGCRFPRHRLRIEPFSA